MGKSLPLALIITLFLWCCTEEEIPQHKLDVSSTPSDGGNVSPQSGEFNDGETIVLTATPANGYIFSTWSGAVSSTVNPLEIELKGDFSITAEFKLDDLDNDGVLGDADLCPDTPAGETVDGQGCSASQKDSDLDGIMDDKDNCPDTAQDEQVNENGCALSQIDSDGDGVHDNIDQCPETPEDAEVDEFGCHASQVDGDQDGVSNENDECPNTPEGESVDQNGCSESQKDTDGDGISDDKDLCPDSPQGESVDQNGCTESQSDKEAPILTGVQVDEISLTSFRVRWYLDEGSKGYIQFGTVSGLYTQTTAVENNLLTEHEQTIGNNNPFPLTANTTYYWQIYTEDQYGNTGFSQEYETTTSAQPEGRPFMFYHVSEYWEPGSYRGSVPTDPQYTYDYTVDWGDGHIDTHVTGDISHTYESSGNKPYPIKIYGQFPKIAFGIQDYGYNRRTNTKVLQWGDIQWQSMESSFSAESVSVQAEDTPDLSLCSSLNKMFANVGFQINESIKEWDVSTITDMGGMFQGTGFNMDISSWDVSQVTNMSGMFAGGVVLVGLSDLFVWGAFDQDISNWDVSNVEYMAYMFDSCEFNQDISSWDVSNVRSMAGMFQASTFNQDISNWDVSNVESMVGMFRNFGYQGPSRSANTFNRDLSSWNVSNVRSMAGMFAASRFNQDIGAWDVSAVEDMSEMFSGSDFDQDISSWDVSNVLDLSHMFAGSPFNHELNTWNVGAVQEMQGMFSNNSDYTSTRVSLFNQDLSSWDTGNVENMRNMFDGAVFDQDISSWDVSSVTEMESMFRDATKFNQDLSIWDVSKVTNCRRFSTNANAWSLPKPNFTNCSP